MTGGHRTPHGRWIPLPVKGRQQEVLPAREQEILLMDFYGGMPQTEIARRPSGSTSCGRLAGGHVISSRDGFAVSGGSVTRWE